MIFNKTAIAAFIALATASTANAEVVLFDKNDWSLSVSGHIDQFLVMTDDKNYDDINEIRDGRGSSIGINISMPKIDDIDINTHMSFHPSTNKSIHDNLTPHEIFFTVNGAFGQILIGKALSLYGSHNLRTDQTNISGLGSRHNDNGTLDGIDFGYDYAVSRRQFRWTSNETNNGVTFAFAVTGNGGAAQMRNTNLPTGGVGTGTRYSEDLRYEADITYDATFNGKKVHLWLSGMSTGNNIANARDAANGENGVTTGGTVDVSAFKFMAQYSNSEGSTDRITDPIKPIPSQLIKWDQYALQAGYQLNKKTLLSVNHAATFNRTPLADPNADEGTRWTVGVYHDINKYVKLVAEFIDVKQEDSKLLDKNIFALGANIDW